MRHRAAFVVPSFAFFAVALSLAASTHAATRTSAAAVDRAVNHYTVGQFAEAIALLAAAIPVAIQRSAPPALLARAHKFKAASHFALGDPVAASTEIIQALAHDPTIAFDPDRFAPPLVALFARVRDGLSGVVRVVCDGALPERAPAITVDGSPSTGCNEGTSLPIGRHVIRAVAAPISRQSTVIIFPGRTVTVTFDLRPPTVPVRDSGRKARLIAGWSFVTAAGASLLGGIVAQALAARAQGDLDRGRTAGFATVGDADAVRAREVASGVFFGVAGASALTGTILVLLGRAPRSPSTAGFRGLNFAAEPAPHGIAATVVRGEWRF
jgi:hypothetical protein